MSCLFFNHFMRIVQKYKSCNEFHRSVPDHLTVDVIRGMHDDFCMSVMKTHYY